MGFFEDLAQWQQNGGAGNELNEAISAWDPRPSTTSQLFSQIGKQGVLAGGGKEDTGQSQFVPYKAPTTIGDSRWNSTNGFYSIAPDEDSTKYSNNPYEWLGVKTPEGYNPLTDFSAWYDPGVGNGLTSELYNRGIRDLGSAAQGPSMTIKGNDGETHRTLLNNDDGTWKLNQGDDAFKDYGYESKDQRDESGNLIGRVLVPTEASGNLPGAIGWKGGDVFENPNEFQRDTYNWLMSDEVQRKLARDYGRENFGNDFMALKSEADLRPLYEEYYMYMRGLEKGYFDSIAGDQRFQDANGEFRFNPYWNWVDENVNIPEIIAGRGNQEGIDWLTSNSYEANQALADYVSRLPELGYRIDELPDDLVGNAVLQDETTLAYGDGANKDRFRMDEEGNVYRIPGNPETMKDVLTSMFVKDALTNKALDDRYGQYAYTADNLNKISRFFGQPDLYYTLGAGEKGPEDPYELFGGDPEEWFNRYAQGFSPQASAENDNKNFRTGATGYAQNNRIGKINRA